MLFINTRPDSRAAELTHALQNKGFQVESLPLLELVAQPFQNHSSTLSAVNWRTSDCSG